VKERHIDRVLHPEDQRRLDYFEALGDVAKQGRPPVEQIERVAEFTQPYDPLMSYFAHHEVARLYAKSAAQGSFAELSHRLHGIYYADPRDRSVRDVAQALMLLVDHRDAVASPEQRYDHINALLEQLKNRWTLRGTGEAGSAEVVLNDVQKSVAALEAAVAEMDRLSQQIALQSDEWPARRTALERALTRPLRTYQSRLLAHHLGEKRKRAAKDQRSPLAN
jgi:hypothetical protein